MRVHIGSDHAAYELKEHLVAHPAEQGHEVVAHGPPALAPQDDYPPYILRTAHAVVADRGSLGLVLGRPGHGDAIPANKVQGVRAALAWNEDTASLGRQHNDANVLSIGARQHTHDEAARFVEVFLETPFSGDARHQRRIDQMSAYERTGELPPLPGGAEA